MSKNLSITLSRRKSGLCPRCGGIRDDKFISCSVCRSVLRQRREVHEAKLKALHSEGWEMPELGDGPMEPDLEDPSVTAPTDFNENTTWVNFGFRTDLSNLYFDF